MSHQTRYNLRKRNNNNHNSSLPPSIIDEPIPSYTPLTLVEFPLFDAKWCCKCPTGPPTVANDNMVECSICKCVWGCRVCHGIDQLSDIDIQDEIVVCFQCVSKCNDSDDIASSDNVGDEDEKELSEIEDKFIIAAACEENQENSPVFSIIAALAAKNIDAAAITIQYSAKACFKKC